ncbi:MAG: N-acetyltransferase [Elusimicrobiota bacterium]|nr:N-acetyltransferase [Elusimicrobiota bacterium]
MKKAPPEKVSQEQVVFKVEELEPILSPDPMNIPPFEPASIKVKTGETMLIRPLKKEEAPMLLNYLKKIIYVDHDFYDIVGARVYAEILGWVRNRLKDPYQMVGLIDGHLVAFCNGRLMNEDINISLHSMAFRRGLRAGAIMYYAKCDYCFETLKQKEFWATYESYNGWKRWGIGMAQPSYPWPDIQHELGGAKVYYITKKYWDTTVKRYLQDMIQSKLERPVSKELLKKNENIIVPEKLEED